MHWAYASAYLVRINSGIVWAPIKDVGIPSAIIWPQARIVILWNPGLEQTAVITVNIRGNVGIQGTALITRHWAKIFIWFSWWIFLFEPIENHVPDIYIFSGQIKNNWFQISETRLSS